MTQIVVRDLDETVQVMLQAQARENGCSVEEEVRRIVSQEVLKGKSGAGTLIASVFKDLDHGLELELRRFEPVRHVEFDD